MPEKPRVAKPEEEEAALEVAEPLEVTVTDLAGNEIKDDEPGYEDPDDPQVLMAGGPEKGFLVSANVPLEDLIFEPKSPRVRISPIDRKVGAIKLLVSVGPDFGGDNADLCIGTNKEKEAFRLLLDVIKPDVFVSWPSDPIPASQVAKVLIETNTEDLRVIAKVDDPEVLHADLAEIEGKKILTLDPQSVGKTNVTVAGTFGGIKIQNARKIEVVDAIGVDDEKGAPITHPVRIYPGVEAFLGHLWTTAPERQIWWSCNRSSVEVRTEVVGEGDEARERVFVKARRSLARPAEITFSSKGISRYTVRIWVG